MRALSSKLITEVKLQNGKTRRRVQTVNKDPSKTQQHFKDHVNVNNIMKKYLQTGAITHLSGKTGVYADITEIGSYQDAMQKVLNANAAFEQLPSELRMKFANDPQNLITYLKDPKNNEESIALGLRIKPEAPKPDPHLDELKEIKKAVSKQKSE